MNRIRVTRFMALRGGLVICSAALLLWLALMDGVPLGWSILAALGGSVFCGWLVDALRTGYIEVYRDGKR